MPSGEPSVTVLVTVRNSAHTVKKCIDSVLRLNYKNKRVYVTDAFSTDGTWEILRGYGKKIRLERVRGNIAEGHNYMIKRCSTDFVALTDADCVVDRNWLRRLVDAFASDDIVASGGNVRTQAGKNKLQELLGRELEDRFKKFPKYVLRLPTMSLCVKTKVAKKNLFNENFDVAQETEWGFRLSRIGKIAFVPNAVVYHYHRANLKSFFKQQYTYGKFAFSLYFRSKNAKRVFGDWITKPSISLQVFLSGFAVLLLIPALAIPAFAYASVLLLSVLMVTYLIDAIRLSRSVSEFLYFIFIFAFRNVAWDLGILRGLFVKFK